MWTLTPQPQLGREPSSGRLSGATVDSDEVMNYLTSVHETIQKQYYTLGESVFDCSLLIFSDKIYLEDSLAICIGVIVSLAIQVTLLLLLGEFQIHDPIDWQWEAWQWRLEHAHNKQHLLDSQNLTLVGALCDSRTTFSRTLPFTTWAGSLKHDIDVYTKDFLGFPIPQGLSMMMIVLVLWICEIIIEVRNSIQMTVAVCFIERTSGSGVKMTRTEKGTFNIAGLGLPRKIGVIFLCFQRCCVAMALCAIGCRFLAQTVQMEELILNAISLAFIVDVDEKLLNVLASPEFKWMMENLESLPAPQWGKGRKQHFMIPSIITVFCIILWCYYMFGFVLPYLDNMHDVTNVLCSGDLNFVVHRNTSGSVQIEGTTEVSNSELLASVSQITGVTPPDHGPGSGSSLWVPAFSRR